MLNSSQKKILMLAAVAASGVVCLASQSHAAMVINEIYGGGGGSSTSSTYSYSQDFVELYNNSPTTSVDLTGMTLQYASAAGTSGFGANTFSIAYLNPITLGPLEYYLVAGSYSSTYKGATLTGYDSTSPLNLAATAGRLELVAADGTTVLDLVGYGSSAITFEGTAPAPAPSNTTSISRASGIDTDHNNLDFTAGTPSPQSSGPFTSTPEPATLGIAAFAGAMLLTRRRAK